MLLSHHNILVYYIRLVSKAIKIQILEKPPHVLRMISPWRIKFGRTIRHAASLRNVG